MSEENANQSSATATTSVNATLSTDLVSEDTWKNRRRMAYISLASNIVFVLLAFVGIIPLGVFELITIEKFRIFIDLIQVYLVTSSSIIAAYIGFATWSYSRAGFR